MIFFWDLLGLLWKSTRYRNTEFAEPQPNRSDSRKDAKADALSFRPNGEIFLRFLAFARDDGLWSVTLRRGGLSVASGEPEGFLNVADNLGAGMLGYFENDARLVLVTGSCSLQKGNTKGSFFNARR